MYANLLSEAYLWDPMKCKPAKLIFDSILLEYLSLSLSLPPPQSINTVGEVERRMKNEKLSTLGV